MNHAHYSAFKSTSRRRYWFTVHSFITTQSLLAGSIATLAIVLKIAESAPAVAPTDSITVSPHPTAPAIATPAAPPEMAAAAAARVATAQIVATCPGDGACLTREANQ